MLYGRGAADMKGAIACFVAAAARFAARHKDGMPGAISLLITGDEEGPAINGTKPCWNGWRSAARSWTPASSASRPIRRKLGEMIKIGRRGSMTGRLTVHGMQGHVAYPHLADNPIHRLAGHADAHDRASRWTRARRISSPPPCRSRRSMSATARPT